MLPLLIALWIAAPVSAPASPTLRLETTAFGQSAEIEILAAPGPPETSQSLRPVLHAAVAALAEVEHLTNPARPESAVAALNAAAGQGPQAVPPSLLPVLAKALDFCLWTEGAHGPLSRGSCDGLAVDSRNRRVALAAESGIDLWSFADGAAIDRAVEVLKQRGVTSGVVRVGGTWRAFGPGPQGKGWTVVLPVFQGTAESAGRIPLRDQALSIADPAAGRPFLNQRTGQPVQGVVATVAVTEIAADARPLAVSLLITGPREGQLRIGSLRPRPSALWLLGNGSGAPLRVFYRWTELTRPPR
ncbi:MAG TPA: FAD:protein FMN transferase [Thermoanaerobaculia bacterium]|nr:FAD:protein FMN transferase [Thermoanaerobaculia bacterium]